MKSVRISVAWESAKAPDSAPDLFTVAGRGEGLCEALEDLARHLQRAHFDLRTLEDGGRPLWPTSSAGGSGGVRVIFVPSAAEVKTAGLVFTAAALQPGGAS